MPNKAEAKVGSVDKKTAKAEKVIKKSASIDDVVKVSTQPTNEVVETEKKEATSYKEKAVEIENNIEEKIKANPTILGKPYRKLISVNKLMETGAHIGLTTKKWNPKMKPYIYTKKGTNHIIDLLQTVISLNKAYNFIYDVTKKNSGSENSPILIVGTRGKIIKNHVKDQSKRVHAFYINERWLGGTLTNFKTITQSINKFNSYILMHKTGEIDNYNKKEKGELKKDTEKLAKFFSGIRTMKELPKVLILTDPEKENIAIKEAKKLGIPVVAICNTNANPENVDFVIPANNYSIKSVYLLIGILCDAIAEAKGLPKQFVDKKDDEILLPEIIKRKAEPRKVVFHQK